MSAPNTPGDFKALISDPTSTLCGNFVNTLLKLPMLLYKLVAYLFDASGNPTVNFVNSVLPSGSVFNAACILPEDGRFLLCDGREVSQTTYANLYTAIGATYGTATAGNFKLPDWRGRVIAGIGTATDINGATNSVALGVADGESKHTLAATEQGKFYATINLIGCAGGGTQVIDAMSLGSATLDTGTHGPLGIPLLAATLGHNNLQPLLGAYVYIVC